ncbi:putative quinol monooxygenase [Eikenella corrodens]|uniref:putative quinol monooxygenase n=1 Tax=Eikenella corrodens TaxID=539 RepID=UPI00129ABE78|nr:putative quinol monooxygenase [Eikenella corrodens]
MITVVAQFEVKPAELDKFLQHCDELIAETRKENGCLSYHLYQNTQQSNQVSFIELWQNQAVLDTHSASAHFTCRNRQRCLHFRLLLEDLVEHLSGIVKNVDRHGKSALFLIMADRCLQII